MKTYVFDIDGTICTQSAPDYTNALPYEKRIKKINELYDKGNEITLYTARGMGRHKNNPLLAVQDFYEFTSKQLEEWGVRYHNLFLGKPNADFYIDDKGISDEDFFKNEVCS
jgi:phosphoglycolate phosphatase-like HAD superfamily hydrolase